MTEFETKNTQELDLSTEEWTDRLAEAPIYAKKGLVGARVAVPGEAITTTLADGTVETTNTAGENQVIITNPGGEEYIIGAEKFNTRYEPTDQEGVFRAKGLARAIKNPTGGDIEITAPWGEKQFGDENRLIATVVNPDDFDEIGADRYIIGGKEFADTYGTYEEVYGPLDS